MTHVDSMESGSEQAAVIAFLSDPRNYPDADAVKRIETHAAIVFLAGDRAYKLKRAVKLPYLDFSTLEKRRAVIERELEINSREVAGALSVRRARNAQPRRTPPGTWKFG